jgi:hypothetical protein
MPITYKQKFNKKYGFDKNTSHSIKDISDLTGYKLDGLETIYEKGMAAFYTNPQSVRPNVKTPHQWASARIYSAVMNGPASHVDANHLVMKS